LRRTSGNSAHIAWKSARSIFTSSTWSSAVQVAERGSSDSSAISPKKFPRER
jgi:hypothetical protein